MSPALWLVDTNIVVSALTSADLASPTRFILESMRARKLRFILSEKLLSEYRRVLLRPRLVAATGMGQVEVDRLLKSLFGAAVVLDADEPSQVAPDPGDNHLWALLEACAGRAGLITGDKLLMAHPPEGITVITPRDWLKRYSTPS